MLVLCCFVLCEYVLLCVALSVWCDCVAFLLVFVLVYVGVFVLCLLWFVVLSCCVCVVVVCGV